MVRTPPSNTESAGSIPGQGVKMPQASRPKVQNVKPKIVKLLEQNVGENLGKFGLDKYFLAITLEHSSFFLKNYS